MYSQYFFIYNIKDWENSQNNNMGMNISFSTPVLLTEWKPVEETCRADIQYKF